MFDNLTYRKVLITYIVWWLSWAVIQFYVLQFYNIDTFPAVVDSLLGTSLLALTGIVIYNTLRFYQPAREIFYLRIWAIVQALLITFLFQWIVKHIITDENYLSFLSNAFPVRSCFNLLMIGLMMVLNSMWFYLRTETEKEQRKTDAEKLAREAELTGLRQQLQPHFLFNSLNSISALAGSRPEEARRMIQQLSDFLRGTLKKDDQQLVTLIEELKHLELYLDIEKVRFGHRLSTEIISEESTLNLLLPSLLLQPIVENAIKFGLYDTTEAIVIRIHSTKKNNDLVITVENPFDPSTAHPNKGTGFGLTSVTRRLYLLFSRNDLLTTTTNQNIFTTTVKIPQA